MTSPLRPPGPLPPARQPAPKSPGPTSEAPAVAKKGPPAGRQFPCRKCGAKLNYDPTASALVCPYCGYVEKIEPQSQQIEERDFEEYLQRQVAEETVLAGRSTEVRCGSCGAVVLLEDNVAMDRCPYCSAVLANQPVAAEAMIPPESVLPFRVSQREAVQAFNEWVASLWFAPSTLKKLANLGQLSGVYVPFWTYDSMTYTRYSGARGIDYTTTETYTTTNAQGQTETQTRLVTHTAWYPASGQIDHFFDDVLVYASHSLPVAMIDALQPWDLASLQHFDPAFLAGFKTERYTVGLPDGFQIAQQRMDQTIRQLCCQDIGGNHQILDSVQTQHVGVTFKHLLLPVWLAVYSYQAQPFRILINARTGEVNGTRPYSWAKISALVIAVVAAAAAIWFASQQH
jgi:DNA-directed RNA polymerase subunit RPC12/RpoP